MDSYLTEIKQLRIPRPKFEPSGSPPTAWHRFVRPYTPPRDYHLSSSNETITVVSSSAGNAAATTTRSRNFQSGSEDFRKSLHDEF